MEKQVKLTFWNCRGRSNSVTYSNSLIKKGQRSYSQSIGCCHMNSRSWSIFIQTLVGQAILGSLSSMMEVGDLEEWQCCGIGIWIGF